MKKIQKEQREKAIRDAQLAEVRKKVQNNVRITDETTLNFQKKYAISKAAEVIQLFEQMAQDDPSINIVKLRKNVLYNLVDRNKDKESDTEYWSMQLLIRLGLIPDPDAKNKKDAEFNPAMTDDERSRKLKEVGLFIPKQNIQELNKEMERMALDNYNKMMIENMQKLSKEEVNTLRKLGLSNE